MRQICLVTAAALLAIAPAAASPFASFGAAPSPILVPEAPIAPDAAYLRLAQVDPGAVQACRTDNSRRTERDCLMIERQKAMD